MIKPFVASLSAAQLLLTCRLPDSAYPPGLLSSSTRWAPSDDPLTDHLDLIQEVIGERLVGHIHREREAQQDDDVPPARLDIVENGIFTNFIEKRLVMALGLQHNSRQFLDLLASEFVDWLYSNEQAVRILNFVLQDRKTIYTLLS